MVNQVSGTDTLADRAELIDQILAQIEPLIARQRRALAQQGCLRAVSSTQLHVLFLLECTGPMAMTRLSEQLGGSLPNVTGIVDRMVEHGLVERHHDASDRRMVLVSNSDLGRETVEEIDIVRRRQLASVLAHMTPDQLERALVTFTDIARAIESAERES